VNPQTLVLWDIDRTLLYVGNTDRRVYQDAFAQVVGRTAEHLPARGTGMTVPLAVQELLRSNDVPTAEVAELSAQVLARLPELLSSRRAEMLAEGHLMPGAESALKAVRDSPDLVAAVVTGNLQRNAEIKLETFGLTGLVQADIGGYASDDSHRPALVAVAQDRARAKHGTAFDRPNTVIIGDSLEDVRTGAQGGASVIGVASGTTTAEELLAAGADAALDSLADPQLLLRTIRELVRDSTSQAQEGCH